MTLISTISRRSSRMYPEKRFSSSTMIPSSYGTPNMIQSSLSSLHLIMRLLSIFRYREFKLYIMTFIIFQRLEVVKTPLGEASLLMLLEVFLKESDNLRILNISYASLGSRVFTSIEKLIKIQPIEILSLRSTCMSTKHFCHLCIALAHL